ncbi:hypothetical protein SHKM778_95640 (plasmid) [Streptomyces sp. KM77-8]|uniref:Uncharacterized protein n=1 Tax=Streptomyces haneummycinicus TaxID=3074435 RepID=A0AAT9I0F6_9ACTN
MTRTALHVLVTVPAWNSQDMDPWGPDVTEVPELTALGFVSPDEAHTILGHHQAIRWAGWTVALATMTPRSQETAQRHTLLRDCAQQAGPAFDAALEPCLDVLDAHRLAEAVRTLAQLPLPAACSIIQRWATAPGRTAESWATALAALAHHGHTPAQTLLTDAVKAGPHGDPQQQERWVRAVRIVMSFDVLPGLWPTIRHHFDETPQLCDEVIGRTATHLTLRHHWPDGVAALSEADLADLHRRLHKREELQQPRPEHEPGVAYPITTTDRLHDLADSLLQLMADTRTQAAATELLALADFVPHQTRRLRRLALRTMRQAAERQLQPLTADQLRRLADDHRKRVISNEVHLLDVVMEALDSVQEALSAPNGLATLLWNRSASAAGSSSWWPMWEEDFSDLVTGLLKMQLEHRRVILNREVQVNRPGVGGGGRTDIHIQAATAPDDPAPVTVVIECKGCWNHTLPTALTDQLVARYLRHPARPVSSWSDSLTATSGTPAGGRSAPRLIAGSRSSSNSTNRPQPIGFPYRPKCWTAGHQGSRPDHDDPPPTCFPVNQWKNGSAAAACQASERCALFETAIVPGFVIRQPTWRAGWTYALSAACGQLMPT